MLRAFAPELCPHWGVTFSSGRSDGRGMFPEL